MVGEVGSWGCCHTTGTQSWSWESGCRDQGSQTWCHIVRWVCGAEVPDTFGYRVCGVLKVVLAYGSDGKASARNAGDPGSIPGSGISPGERNGTPLKYSCLENPLDGRAWWATVQGVAKSRTRLSNFTFTFTRGQGWGQAGPRVGSGLPGAGWVCRKRDHGFSESGVRPRWVGLVQRLLGAGLGAGDSGNMMELGPRPRGF